MEVDSTTTAIQSVESAKPSVQFMQELSAWTVGQRIEFAAQCLVYETGQLFNSGYLTIEIRSMSGKLCDYKVSSNLKLNDIRGL